jgi:hypothetical protein
MNSNFMNGFADEFFKVGAVQPGEGTSYVQGGSRARSGVSRPPAPPRPAASSGKNRLMAPTLDKAGRGGLTGRQAKIVAGGGTKFQKDIRAAGGIKSEGGQKLIAARRASRQDARTQRQAALGSQLGGRPTGKQTGFTAKAPKPAKGAVAAAPKPAKTPNLNWQGQPSKAGVGRPKGMRANPNTDEGRRQGKQMRQARRKSTRENLQAGRAYTAAGPGGAAPSAAPKPSPVATPKKPSQSLVSGIQNYAKKLNPFS